MISDAEIDALLTSGDHEAAARRAAELADPATYREAMIRAFRIAEACKGCGPRSNYSHEARQESQA